MIKRNLIILSIFINIIINAQIPVYAWAKQIGGNFEQIGNSIKVDVSGNVYTTGYYSGIVDFDPGPGVYNLTSNGGRDIFISKLDALGNFIWAISIGGATIDQGLSIEIDNLGYIYVTGNFSGTVDFDNSLGVYNLTSTGAVYDMFVLKLNFLGDFVWAKSIGNTSNENPYYIKKDFIGNIYILGTFYGVVDFDPSVAISNLSSIGGGNDIFILKLDSNGDYLWAKRFGGNQGDLGKSLVFDLIGNIYVTGSIFSSIADLDPGPGVYNLSFLDGFDIFVLKLDPLGNFKWAKEIGGNSNDFANCIDINSNGEIYITGSFGYLLDFDPGIGVNNLSPLPGSTNVFILKLDSAGNFIWAKDMGGNGYSAGYSITIDGSDNIYCTGIFEAVTDFDPNSGIFNLSSNGGEDIFIAKFNGIGNLLSAKQIGGISYEKSNSITTDVSGNVYVTGYFNRNVDFNPDSGIDNLNCLDTNDVFILKLDHGIVNLIESEELNNISIFPNPSNSFINIEFKNFNNENTIIQILNSLGEILLNEQINKQNCRFNIEKFPLGIYFVKITQNEKQQIIKLIKE